MQRSLSMFSQHFAVKSPADHHAYTPKDLFQDEIFHVETHKTGIFFSTRKEKAQ